MKKTAIITGASRGIGYAAAKKLGMDGCQVVLFATGEKERYKAVIDGLRQGASDQGNSRKIRKNRYSGK